MSDNEPRMEDRLLANQMFTIDTSIKKLMKEYDMVVRNQEFGRAQEIADEIGMLDVQKSTAASWFCITKNVTTTTNNGTTTTNATKSSARRNTANTRFYIYLAVLWQREKKHYLN